MREEATTGLFLTLAEKTVTLKEPMDLLLLWRSTDQQLTLLHC